MDGARREGGCMRRHWILALLVVAAFVLTTGPAGPLTWEEAADALERALGPIIDDARRRDIPFGLEHTDCQRRVLVIISGDRGA